jgi:uncharacterized protein YbjT (DUF2867 family)
MLGSRIVYRLLDEGHSVRAFVRPKSDYHPLEAAGAEIAFGDLLEPDTFPAALKGVERVVASATAPLMERHLEEACQAVDGRGLQDLINASKEAGVNQFVFISSNGFNPGIPIPLIEAKSATEQHLAKSGISYTVLKPDKFIEVWIGFFIGSQLQSGPKVTIVGDGKARLCFTAMENVLDLVSGVLGHPAAENAVIPLCAPDKFSYRELVALIGSLTGMEIEVNSIGADDPFPGFPLLLPSLWAWMEASGDCTVDSREVARTFGFKLIGVEESLKQMFTMPVK